MRRGSNAAMFRNYERAFDRMIEAVMPKTFAGDPEQQAPVMTDADTRQPRILRATVAELTQKGVSR